MYCLVINCCVNRFNSNATKTSSAVGRAAATNHVPMWQIWETTFRYGGWLRNNRASVWRISSYSEHTVKKWLPCWETTDWQIHDVFIFANVFAPGCTFRRVAKHMQPSDASSAAALITKRIEVQQALTFWMFISSGISNEDTTVRYSWDSWLSLVNRQNLDLAGSRQ